MWTACDRGPLRAAAVAETGHLRRGAEREGAAALPSERALPASALPVDAGDRHRCAVRLCVTATARRRRRRRRPRTTTAVRAVCTRVRRRAGHVPRLVDPRRGARRRARHRVGAGQWFGGCQQLRGPDVRGPRGAPPARRGFRHPDGRDGAHDRARFRRTTSTIGDARVVGRLRDRRAGRTGIHRRSDLDSTGPAIHHRPVRPCEADQGTGRRGSPVWNNRSGHGCSRGRNGRTHAVVPPPG